MDPTVPAANHTAQALGAALVAPKQGPSSVLVSTAEGSDAALGGGGGGGQVIPSSSQSSAGQPLPEAHLLQEEEEEGGGRSALKYRRLADDAERHAVSNDQ